jgi:hypothetical protein
LRCSDVEITHYPIKYPGGHCLYAILYKNRLFLCMIDAIV